MVLGIPQCRTCWVLERVSGEDFQDIALLQVGSSCWLPKSSEKEGRYRFWKGGGAQCGGVIDRRLAESSLAIAGH